MRTGTDTHVAHADRVTHGCSELVTRELCGHSYRGRMFPEYRAATAETDKQKLLWAAWSETDAFWPLENDPIAMILNAGFSSVEQVDPVADGRADRWAVDPINRAVVIARV